MADSELLAKLRKGVRAWNAWRSRISYVDLDLTRADLRGRDLSSANLGNTNLNGANLSGVNLIDSNFMYSSLRDVDLSEANLSGADMYGADLTRATLARANLFDTSLKGTILQGTDMTDAKIEGAIFGDNDLSTARGLETVVHFAPSTIGIDTIYRSKGNIPEPFLRGCGIPDDFIVYMRSLAGSPIEFYSCFISYSNKDDAFSTELHTKLQVQHVRCWKDSEDLKIGDRFQEEIERAIRLHDKLLVVLSENSVKSSWVEREVQAALEKEQRQGSIVLFPVRLDDAVMDCQRAWAADIRRTRHIGDFRKWKDHDSFQKSLDRLLRDLRSQDSKPKMTAL
jgi:hypothetical protein